MGIEKRIRSLDVKTAPVQNTAPRRKTLAEKWPYKHLAAYGTATALSLGGATFSAYKTGVAPEEVAAYLAPPSQTELSQAQFTLRKGTLFDQCIKLYYPEEKPTQANVASISKTKEFPACEDLRVDPDDQARAQKTIDRVEVFNAGVMDRKLKWAGVFLGFFCLSAAGLEGVVNDTYASRVKLEKRLAHKQGEPKR